jgi:hypothetical protein
MSKKILHKKMIKMSSDTSAAEGSKGHKREGQQALCRLRESSNRSSSTDEIKVTRPNAPRNSKGKGSVPRKVLRFTCPHCGSHDLRVLVLTAYYPVMSFDRVEVNPFDFQDCTMHHREHSDWYATDECEGFEFECGGCGHAPNFEDENGRHVIADASDLAKWLYVNCQQDDQ